MIAVLKIIVVALLSGLAWLIGKYAVEYFRPYDRS